jgi:uncharacterized membrane protein
MWLKIMQTIVLFLCSEISSLKSFAIAWSVSSGAWQIVVCIFTYSSSAIIASKSPKAKIKIRKSRI